MHLDKPMTESERAKEAVLASMNTSWSGIRLTTSDFETFKVELDSPFGAEISTEFSRQQMLDFFEQCRLAITAGKGANR